MRKALTIIFAMACLACAEAQETRVSGYRQPWTGGLNACQFGQIDIDGDGKKDLIVFDRHGNRLLTYINEGGENEVHYSYHPEYQQFFPHIDDWLIITDYDGDGHNDIFTYSKGWAGIKVLRNTGETPPRFEIAASPYLTSLQNGGSVNILATNADYPALIDLDGDGDIDLLTFGVLGTFIEKHQNMSMEKYGTADSLTFEKTDNCWGFVAESEENNALYLDTCLFGQAFFVDGDTRHRGATFAVRDIDGNGLLDLLLGDVDYPTLTFLKNDGSTPTAVMASQTDIFPDNDPIHLFSMPLPYFGDINNDGLTDMIVSPFDPNGLSCEGIGSIWLYLNEGSEQHPDFRLHTKAFLQEDMIDIGTGAYPFFCDIDSDGKTDLIVGTIGNITSTEYVNGTLKTQRAAKITAFLNIGEASNPVLQHGDNDLGGLSSLKRTYLTPTAADIDGDGKTEYLFGSAKGPITLTDSDFNVIDTNFLDFGLPYSAPCLFDIDGDGITDLTVGHKDGKLSFYKGTHANGATVFLLVSHAWGGVDVRDYDNSFFGHSTPCLFNHDNETMLLVGSEQGKLFLFSNISPEHDDTFTDVTYILDELFEHFDNNFGTMAAPAMADLDGDGKSELVVGNFGGGLQLFNTEIEVIHSVTPHTKTSFSVWPNPANDILHIGTSKCAVVSITDLAGRTVKRHNGDGDIDISDLRQGVYFVTIVGDDTATALKIIKM